MALAVGLFVSFDEKKNISEQHKKFRNHSVDYYNYLHKFMNMKIFTQQKKTNHLIHKDIEQILLSTF